MRGSGEADVTRLRTCQVLESLYWLGAGLGEAAGLECGLGEPAGAASLREPAGASAGASAMEGGTEQRNALELGELIQWSGYVEIAGSIVSRRDGLTTAGTCLIGTPGPPPSSQPPRRCWRGLQPRRGREAAPLSPGAPLSASRRATVSAWCARRALWPSAAGTRD